MAYQWPNCQFPRQRQLGAGERKAHSWWGNLKSCDKLSQTLLALAQSGRTAIFFIQIGGRQREKQVSLRKTVNPSRHFADGRATSRLHSNPLPHWMSKFDQTATSDAPRRYHWKLAGVGREWTREI